ncbi:hypothetical protein TNCV_3071131 [Trichonephila clavipes]|nr:hypothetical protein TNCV_3071131 [Trichonephila clavipes]
MSSNCSENFDANGPGLARPIGTLSISSALSSNSSRSPVVKISDHDRHVMSLSPVPVKTRRLGVRCTLNLTRDQTSSRWYGS